MKISPKDYVMMQIILLQDSEFRRKRLGKDDVIERAKDYVDDVLKKSNVQIQECDVHGNIVKTDNISSSSDSKKDSSRVLGLLVKACKIIKKNNVLDENNYGFTCVESENLLEEVSILGIRYEDS